MIRGMAHITGGGLEENLTRILPKGRRVRIDCGAWEVPQLFRWLENLGGVERSEMFHVFNMGIGFALITSSHFAGSIQRQLADHRIRSWVIGEVVEGEPGVDLLD